MRKEIIDNLKMLTFEEKEILEGNQNVDKRIYSDYASFVVDMNKFLSEEEMINIRKHTRFIDFPKHSHNYVEINYVFQGKLVQIIDDKKFDLQQGELIFLNQRISHEIMKSSVEDIIINFIIRPEFFSYIFSLAEGNNIIFDFLMETMYVNQGLGGFLYFKVSDDKKIQMIIEEIITEVYENRTTSIISTKLLVGLLLVELMKHEDKMYQYTENDEERMIIVKTLKYIDENYATASLSQLANILNLPNYKISRIIKKSTTFTFKQLVQETKMKQVIHLLIHTQLPILDIMHSVGYENMTYFYELFKEKYVITPKEYRQMYFKGRY